MTQKQFPAAQQPVGVEKCGKASPAVVLCFAAPIKAGKTTITNRLAARLSASRISFGDYLRKVARQSGLEVTREVLQVLGEKLVCSDVRRFCEDVLAEHPWKSGTLLVIDGVRHVEVLNSLSEIFSPAKVYLIYIHLDPLTQQARLKLDPLPHETTLDALEKHPTEQQVKAELRNLAALVLDGTEEADKSVDQIVEFLVAKCALQKHDGC